MRSSVKTTPVESTKADLAAVAVCTLAGRLPRSLTALDKTTQGAIGRLVGSGDFTGKLDEHALLYPASGPSRVLLVGLGKQDGVTPRAIRRAAAVAARKAISTGAASLSFRLGENVPRRACPTQTLGQIAVEGAAQGAWTFEDLRSKPDSTAELKTLTILVDEKDRAAAEGGRKIGAAVAEGHTLARNLQMLPGNHCPPSHLAKVARDMGRRHGFKVSVLGRAQIEKAGLTALLCVAQGSKEDPRFITITHQGAGKKAPVCLVGKGVTFDSGGISLKPAANMEDMKFDMSGAAAVLGTMETVGRLKPKLNVVAVIPSTENLPSGTAVKPGDVIATHLGKTVEVINTDAEGRLILCDALSYARRFKPACILDAATLTGAVVVGLGHHATGIMGNNEALLSEVQKAGEAAGERCWPLPLWDEYRPQIKSGTADIKNTGGRSAGTITAAWFLREFVEDQTPWVHLDIAGTAYTDSDSPPQSKGPTGAGVRLFTEFILERAAG